MPKVALVTGASRGIGRAVARAFARENYTVIAGYLNSASAARELEEELRGEGKNVFAVRADVAEEAGAAALVDFALSRFHRLDALVHCAGVAKSGLITDIPQAEVDRLFAVNLRGSYLLCRASLAPMISAKRGSVVLVSSVWGAVGASCEAAYSASKGGAIALTKALAKEAGPSGVRVNCVLPGVIRTDMLNEYSEAELRALADATPLGRLGTPEEIAEVALFLASDKASFVTGQALAADGGFAV